jgi:hypothetical protein
MTVIKRTCMYCDKDMGTRDGKGMTGVSHGICDECGKKSDAELDAMATAKNANSKPIKSFKDFLK